MTLRSKWLFVLVALVFLGMVASPVSAVQPIRIGVISPISGNYGDHGALERAGMQMALDEYGGEVLGRPITMITADSETNPDVSARRARRLIEVDGVKFIMGGVNSSVAIAVGAVAEEKKILYINTNGNADTITGEYARHHVFRSAPDMATLVRGGAKYVSENLGKKWFFITHDYSWGQSGTKWARNSMKELGCTEVGEIKVPMGTRDFSSQLLQIRNSGADVLVITCAGFDNVALLKQLAEYKMYDKMKVWYTLMDYVDMWPLAKAERQPYLMTEVYWNENDATRAWTEKFHNKYPAAAAPVLDNGNYNGWLVMKALIEAIKKAGTADDVEKVIAALEGLTIKDNLRSTPTYVRPWDHQFLMNVVLAKANPAATGTDIFEVKAIIPSVSVARTQQENPVDVSCKAVKAAAKVKKKK
jgi:branched-chain amino acid transport system substrate-binding protein